MENQQNKYKVSVIIAAAGNSSRMGNDGISKQFVLLKEKPLLLYSLEKFSMLKNLCEIVIVTNDINVVSDSMRDWFSSRLRINIVLGGKLRQDSVYNGFCKLDSSIDLVVIHDVARPLFEICDVEKCIERAIHGGAAVLATPVVDTLKRGQKFKSDKDEFIKVESTINREGLYMIQTPQVFSYDLLANAYKWYKSKYKSASGIPFTDEAMLVELFGKPVNLVIGGRKNIKITYPEDLEVASLILSKSKNLSKNVRNSKN